MFNKWKDQLNEKFKKKANDADGDQESDTVSNASLQGQMAQQQPQQPQPEQVTFNLNTMDQFSSEELQQVIRKYDAGIQKMKASIAEKNEKIVTLESQSAKDCHEMEEIKSMAEMQAEENKTLKQHVHTFNEENKSLKNLVSVLETDVDKLDDLEAKLEQKTKLYEKEKELNEQLLKSVNEGEDTGDSGDDSTPNLTVSGTEQIFRQKFEAEQQLSMKLQDEMRELKVQHAAWETATESHVKSKEKAWQQFREQQDQNVALTKLTEALQQEIEVKENETEQLRGRFAESESENERLKMQLQETQNLLALQESDSGAQRNVNDTQINELMERMRGKDLVIDQNANEMRQLQTKLKSQDTSIAYFKRQIQELDESLEQEKSEKQTLKREMVSYSSRQEEEESAQRDHQQSSTNGAKGDGFEQFKALLSTANEQMGENEPAESETVDQATESAQAPQSDEKDAQLKELKDELVKLADDYSALGIAKSKLEEKLSEQVDQSGELQGQVDKMTEDAQRMKLTIKELEKRRDQAIKEIRSLKHQIAKEKKAAAEVTAIAAQAIKE